MYKYKQVLELKYDQLPNRVQQEMRSRRGFAFDQIMSFRSMHTHWMANPAVALQEFVTLDTLVAIHEYHVSEYDYPGDLSQFVQDKDLQFFKWLVDENFALPHVDDIYVDSSM